MIICIVAFCVQCVLHCTCVYLSYSHGVLRFDSMSILVSVLCWSPGWYSRIKLGRMYNILVRRGIVVLCAVLGSVSILVSQGARARATASPAALRGLGMSSLGKCWCSLSIVANNFSKNTTPPMPSIPSILPTMPSQALESLPMLMPVSGAAYSWYIKLPTSPKILCHKFLKCLQESKQTYLSKGCHTRGHTWERADKVHWGFTWCQTDKDVRREVQAHRISHSSRRTRGDSVRDRGVDKSEQVPASSKDETICRVLSSFSSPSVQTFDIQSGIRVQRSWK